MLTRTLESSSSCSAFHSHSFSSSCIELFQLSQLFLFVLVVRKMGEHEGEPHERGVRGDAEPESKFERRRGSWGWGRTIASGVTPEARRVCMVIVAERGAVVSGAGVVAASVDGELGDGRR